MVQQPSCFICVYLFISVKVGHKNKLNITALALGKKGFDTIFLSECVLEITHQAPSYSSLGKKSCPKGGPIWTVLSKSWLLLFNSLHRFCGACSLLISNWCLPHTEIRGCPLEWRVLYVQVLIWEFRGFLISAVSFMGGILLFSRCPEKTKDVS